MGITLTRRPRGKDGEIPVQDVDYQSQKTLAYLACRTAIKVGEVLTQEERKVITPIRMADQSISI